VPVRPGQVVYPPTPTQVAGSWKKEKLILPVVSLTLYIASIPYLTMYSSYYSVWAEDRKVDFCWDMHGFGPHTTPAQPDLTC